MGHISDRTLDNLLDGSIDDAGELAIEEHVRHCERCARRLREWQVLFPQIRSLIPNTEAPNFAEPAVAAGPRTPSVFVPDWSPPPSHRSLPTRMAWGLVVVLAAGAVYLLFQGTAEQPAIGVLPETYTPPVEQAATPDSGLGVGIGQSTQAAVPPVDSAKPATALQPAPVAARDTAKPATPTPQQPAQREAAPAEREPAPATREVAQEPREQDVRVPAAGRDRPVTFPIKASQATRQPVQPSTPAAGGPTGSATDTASLPPLTAQFERTSLGDAVKRLAGTVRLIDGLTAEAVEVAQGTALPGADPDKPVVRVVYNAPEGRLILDQQRLGRPGSREPNIAISTAPNGVSVAQWIDRGGFWISLAGRADQQTLLAIANRVR